MKSGWEEIELGKIAPANSNGMPDDNVEVWNLSLDEVESVTGRILNKTIRRVSELGSSKCSFDTRHVLYSKLRPYLNKVVLPDEPGVGTSELIPMLPDTKKLDREYLAFYLRSPMFLDFAKANTRGANLPRVAMKELWKHKVPFPDSLDEQRRIVIRIYECIERMEEIEQLRTETIEEAEATLPSLLNEAFVDLGEAYKKVEISDVAVETRYGTSKKCSTTPNGTAILRIPNVVGGFVNFDNLKYCLLDRKEREMIILQQGDLLFVRTNGSRDLVGRCAIYEGNKADNNHGFASYLIRIRLDQDKMRPHFLAFYLNSTHGRSELDKRRRTSAGQFNINSENLRNIEVPLPPVSIQDRINERLRDGQAQVNQLQSELQDAHETGLHLRESILRKAFAGEL